MSSAHSPSKLNTALDVPATSATVSPESPRTPVPRVPMHATDVAVVQLLVEQSAIANTAVGVTFVVAKLMPVNVTLAVIEATLYGADVVNTGAVECRDERTTRKTLIRQVKTERIPSKLNTADDVPATLTTNSSDVPVDPMPRKPMHATDVAVVQLLVRQSAIATWAVTVKLVEPKFEPVSVMLATTEATL